MPTPSGWVFLVLIGLLMPLAAVRGAMRVRREGVTPTRAQYFASVAISQTVPVVLALLAARYEWIELFPGPGVTMAGAAAAGVFLVVALGTLPLRWRWKPREQRRKSLWIYPNSVRDLWWWTLVSLAAGVGEEIVYRGVMFTMVSRMLGGWWPAAAVCSVVFAVAHAVQGWRAVVVIVAMSLGFHWIVRLSGNLYIAMATHVVYDFLAGIVIMWLIRRDGLAGPAREGAAAAEGDALRVSTPR